jgi:ABC-type microcin C transport system permease subunit YejE
VLIISISLTGWVQYARTVRGTTLVERNKEYVQAARVTGVAPLRIMFKHVLPNVMGPVMVLATIQVATAIITAVDGADRSPTLGLYETAGRPDSGLHAEGMKSGSFWCLRSNFRKS